jgi:MSHA biogenesis protein MshI
MLGLRSQSAKLLRTGLLHGVSARAAALVSHVEGDRPQLLQAVFEARNGSAAPSRGTQQMLQRLRGTHSPVAAVLGATDYQIVSSAVPDLPPEEQREALRWRIRDQVSIPAETAVIDCFALPATRGAGASLQVIVAPPAAIDAIEAVVRGARRTLGSVDIEELALRNLMTQLPQEAYGCALVFIGRGAINILVSCAGVLYLSRRLDASLRNDGTQLALELQRSLQYYESQFDRAPVVEAIIGPDGDAARVLAPEIAAASGLQVKLLELGACLDLAPGVAALNEPELLLAIGAALRPANAAAGG